MRAPLALLAAVALVVFAAVTTPGPAAAQAGPGSTRTWSIAPATADGIDGRAHLVHDLAPGQAVTDAVAVTNHATEVLRLDLYANDAFTTADGGFDLLPRADEPVDAGTWITLAAETLEVAPGATAVVPVTISVPADAEPGDHVGGVVATLVTTSSDGASQQVAVEHRVGTRVYLRVDGPLEPRLEISALDVRHHGSLSPVSAGSVDVAYTVTNIGNIRLSGRQEVRVTGPFGTELGRVVLPDLPELLPGAAIEQRTSVSGISPLGRLTGEVTVTPVDLDGEVEPEPTTASASTWAVPWIQLLVLGLVAALAVRAIRRRRGSAAPTTAGTPDAGAPEPEIATTAPG